MDKSCLWRLFVQPSALPPFRRFLLAGLLLSACAPLAASAAAPAADGASPLALVLVAALSAALAAAIGYRIGHLRTKRQQDTQAKRAHMRASLIDLASDWTWRTDHNHRYLAISRGFHGCTGLDPATLIGRSPWDLAGPATESVDWEPYRASLKEQEKITHTFPLRGADGHIRHFELIGQPLLRNGLFAGYHGIGRDITEQVTTARALHKSQQRYSEMVESVNEVIFRSDTEGRLTFLNSFWRTVSGYRVDQALGKSLASFLHPDDCASAQAHFADVIAGRQPECRCELRLRTRKGEIRWIEAAGRPIVDVDEAPLGIAGTLSDISSRKVAELTLKNVNQDLEARVHQRTAELEASNQELEAFSYSVSHDLRAPLRAIDGFARILEEELADRLDDDSRGHINRIRKATQRMAHLTDALIELARLTREPLRKETFDLSAMAVQIMDELRAGEPARVVELEIGQGLMVTADRVLVLVLLENLLHNAWKFSAREPVTRITFRAGRENGQRVFCIEDNGAGFDMAFAANLFRPFHRLHSASEFSGTGIGLATVQRIIQRHGGMIWAYSNPGDGARFCFTLGN